MGVGITLRGIAGTVNLILLEQSLGFNMKAVTGKRFRKAFKIVME